MNEVRVRIALAIDHNGDWVATGGSYYEGDPEFGDIIDTLEPGEKRYFIDATVLKPEFPVIPVEGTPTEVEARPQ